MKSHTTGTSKSLNLQLYKIVRVGDKWDSHVYTFIVPAQLTRGFLQSAQSREFTYGGLKWHVRLEYYSDPLDAQARRGSSLVVNYQKQPLGVSLHAMGLSGGISCQLEYLRFSILHQGHFSRNLIREEVGSKLTSVNNSVKVSRWIEPGSLSKEHYLFDDWSGMLEVEIRGALTTYEEQLRVPRDQKEAVRCKSLESTSFTYAGIDWSLLLDWKNPVKQGINDERDYRPTFCIQRHNRAKQWTRLRYKTTINWHDLGTSQSAPMEQLVPPEIGATTSPIPIGERRWFINASGPTLGVKHHISLSIEFTMVAHISRVDLIPTAPQGGRNCSRVSDPDAFDWIVMSDILGSLVKLRIFPDPDNLISQRKEETENRIMVRSTAIAVHLIPFDPSMNVVNSLSPFYTITLPMVPKSQGDNHLEVTDISQDMILNLDVDKVCSSEFGYSRPNDNSITLRIEWIHVCLLSRAEHRSYDELPNLHHYQLNQEFQTQKMELRRLHNHRRDDTSNTRNNAVQLSSSASPAHHSDNGRRSSNHEHIERRHTCASTDPNNRGSSRTGRHESLHGSLLSQPGGQTNTGEAHGRIRPPTIHTQVLINGSPQSGHLEAPSNQLMPGGSAWRRHSSCLDRVNSKNSTTRRRLPSPPSTTGASDEHLSVNFYAKDNYNSCSSPRLNMRNSVDQYDS